jgi:hypothetical protein
MLIQQLPIGFPLLTNTYFQNNHHVIFLLVTKHASFPPSPKTQRLKPPQSLLLTPPQHKPAQQKQSLQSIVTHGRFKLKTKTKTKKPSFSPKPKK